VRGRTRHLITCHVYTLYLSSTVTFIRKCDRRASTLHMPYDACSTYFDHHTPSTILLPRIYKPSLALILLPLESSFFFLPLFISNATMSNQVSTTSADQMVDILSLVEEGYGAYLPLQLNGTVSPGSTPRRGPSTPTRHLEAMQRLRDLARGVQSQFNNVWSYLRDDRSDRSPVANSGSIHGALFHGTLSTTYRAISELLPPCSRSTG
jgi:hypothetical protein